MFVRLALRVRESMAAVSDSSRFHGRTGSLVTITNGGRTAQRNQPVQEFNNGVVLSAEHLRDDQLFEVKIDSKVNSWSGSIEIGVTTCDPNNLDFPTSATGFREGTWVMSGCSIMKDGHTIIDEYGQDLDQLCEGHTVGVLRTSSGVLHFYVNGTDQGVAATGVPSPVYAVVDMYGKCARVSVVQTGGPEPEQQALSNDLANEAIVEATAAAAAASVVVPPVDRLTFHEKCGSLVKLSCTRRTAERRKPLDEFNNGVVMSNRPLRDNEMFEIRIDRLVDKWSGSIEVGITTHNPQLLDFPATMTNMRSGTIMMSGCGILTNGKGTRREYGEHNLDELQEGDRIAMMRKASGALHYYVNGHDQGVAAARAPQVAWAVVDLYGMAVKVTIVDSQVAVLRGQSQLMASSIVSNALQELTLGETPGDTEVARREVDRLLFHPRCGSRAAVVGGQLTAHRPNAVDDFNNGVVLTGRTLAAGEMFEIRLDIMVEKWAGSIEIGVTTHSPHELNFPSTMTNIRSGTWMMTGNGVMHNGTTVIDEYGMNLDRLKVGDRVGVVRKANGTLNFFVNGADQGAAATNVPEHVYGVIDLYGQAAQATIIDHRDPLNIPAVEITMDLDVCGDELGFHQMHGRNASISASCKTASRPNAHGEFNDAIVMSNRPLKDNELFEVTMEKMVERWSGSIEAGVTTILPQDIEFPNTMTDIDYDTWMLSGSAIMQDGSTIRNGYRLDLDTLAAGARVGMMRRSNGALHYFLNGTDMGVACTDIPPSVFCVVDLYGQCAQVTISSGCGVRPLELNTDNTVDILPSITSPITADLSHRFSQCAGRNITLQSNCSIASRTHHFDHGVVFSADPLRPGELFEVQVRQVSRQWSGSLQIGLTSMAVSDTTPVSSLPPHALSITAKPTWLVTGSQVRKNGNTIKENYAPSLDRLEVGDRVGIRRSQEGAMHVLLNGEDLGVAATSIPKNVFAVLDLYGVVDQVAIVSSLFSEVLRSRPPSLPSDSDTDSAPCVEDEDRDTADGGYLEFHSHHGRNIQLSADGLTAHRTASYNGGLVISHRPLPRNQLFQVRVSSLNSRWTSSLMIGVWICSPECASSLPTTALATKKHCWLIHADAVFYCGTKVRERYGPDLDRLRVGQTVGVLVDNASCLHLYVDGVDQGVAARDLPRTCYALVDLYGQCDHVAIVTDQGEDSAGGGPPVGEYREKALMEEGLKEKISTAPQAPPPSLPAKNCEYQNICTRLKATLGLPDGYFLPEHNTCYCEACHRVRGEEASFKHGDPPKEYAEPVGWCKFALRLPPKAEVIHVYEKWHLAYHGSTAPLVRRILDTRDLTLTGDVTASAVHPLTPQRHLLEEKKNKPPEDADHKPVILSPSVSQAGDQLHAPKFVLKDPKTRKLQWTRVAFQVCVKPGSYNAATNSLTDPRQGAGDTEWRTKEQGAVVLCALLVRVEQ